MVFSISFDVCILLSPIKCLLEAAVWYILSSSSSRLLCEPIHLELSLLQATSTLISSLSLLYFLGFPPITSSLGCHVILNMTFICSFYKHFWSICPALDLKIQQ